MERSPSDFRTLCAGAADAKTLTPGTSVVYTPAPGMPWFRGIVDDEPRMLGGGDKVVSLRDMEASYGVWAGRHCTRIAAAALTHVRLARAVS